MSGSNPFRRDRQFAEDATPNLSRKREDEADATARFPPLTIETTSARVIPQAKHVQFASPPAPETPLLYSHPSSSPESPDSYRHIGAPAGSLRTGPGLSNPSDPFRANDSEPDNGSADGGRPRYTGAEPALTSDVADRGWDGPQARLQHGSAITSGTHEKPVIDGRSDHATGAGQETGRGKQAMDVDAFKRLLLTGEPAATKQHDGPALLLPTANHASVGDSSSSNTDSASVSRQSIFEPIPAIPSETPRTSHELDPEDADDERRDLFVSPSQSRQRPSVPKSRHGKMLVNVPHSSNPTAPAGADPESLFEANVLPNRGDWNYTSTDLNKPLPQPPSDRSPGTIRVEDSGPAYTPQMPAKKPPTPPLSRRQSQIRSQKIYSLGSSSSKTFEVKDVDSASSLSLVTASPMTKAPPPPPARRLNRNSTHGPPPSEHLAPLLDDEPSRNPLSIEFPSAGIDSDAGYRQPLVKPPPSRTPSSASRASVTTTGVAMTGGPPPPPPPRRMRGLSRSSFDSQRPAVSDLRRPSAESSRNVSGSSNATDILADLAALQREVDALRNNAGPGV